jgi:hypothetical protein
VQVTVVIDVISWNKSVPFQLVAGTPEQFFCVQGLAAACDAPAVEQLHPLSVTQVAVSVVTVKPMTAVQALVCCA